MKEVKQRNFTILKNYKREINLSTRFVSDKTKYSRKIKHKNQAY